LKRRNEENPETPTPFPTPPNNELNQTKSQIQITYNLNSEEFNLVLEPLSDSELLKMVSKLISKVKTGAQNTDLDSLYETLKTYQEASDGSLKKSAYLALNSYQQQVDQLISSLARQKECRSNLLQALMSAQDEAKLNQIYQAIKADPELYGEHNQSLVDNHQKRVVRALQISSSDSGDSAAELALTLRTIITSDSEEEELINLQRKIQEYQTAQAELYQQYRAIINQMEQEIQTELTRRNKSDEPQDSPPAPHPTSQPSGEKGLVLFLVGLGGIAVLLTLTYLY
jgi:hypothetical protein